ncbi:MAG: hydrogenase maturation protease [Chloroflexi bacterium]|nr:hydrogenase maturation protease [Chloroflexota bacterium]
MDTLPSFCRARVLILGVGNVLFGNDGFGPQVIDYLTRHYVIPEDIYAIDVGTGARKVLFTVTLSQTRPQELVIADAVDWGQEIGSVLEIPVELLPVTKVDDFSLHQVPTSNMLRELQDDCGVKVSVVVCDVGEIPQVIEPGLSSAIEAAVVTAGEKMASRYELRLLLP